MWTPLVLGVAFLALVKWPLRAWLDAVAHGLDPSLLAAYTVIAVVLASYRGSLASRLGAARAEGGGLGRGVIDDARLSLPRWCAAFEQLALMSLAIAFLLGLVYAPQEKTMGQIQRIFYVHVPSAWLGGLAFAIVCGASIAYLVWRRDEADRVAGAAAEVGLVFTALVLITGPIWARPVWGVWWAWDPRLTLTLVIGLLYAGYLMLRTYVEDGSRRRTLAAVVGILNFVAIPINYMAIQWWRTQHPAPVIGGDGKLDPAMLRAFGFGLLAFTVVFFALFLPRLGLARLDDDNDERARRAAL